MYFRPQRPELDRAATTSAPAEAPFGRPAGEANAADRPADGEDEVGHGRRLAARLGLGFLDRLVVEPEPADRPPPDPEVFRRADRMLLGHGDAAILVTAPEGEAVALLADHLARHPELRPRVAIAAPREIRRALIERHAAALARRAVGAVLDRDPRHSAARTASPAQIALVAALVVAWGAAAFDLSRTLLAAWTLLFLAIGLIRAHVADTVGTPAAHPPLAEADLPRFAVLVPLYREAEVIDDLVAALARLDYPADRLDLRLVLEADDVETVRAAEAAVVGTAVEIIVVPPVAPRTKPKALNFALACVDADIVTVFDAEDRPDPDQLRKAAAAFRAGGPDLAVVQAALEIDHAEPDRPWLVRQFEIEYAMLFHGLLPWLATRRLFLPLGGTSNHFRRTALAVIGGWDPHNVTEDADIAARLMRHGFRADVIAAATLEEAPLDLPRWHAQRVRWMKGWMQTWLAHVRRPWIARHPAGPLARLSFHLLIAGQLASVLVFLPSAALLLAQVTGLLPFLVDRDFAGDLLLVSGLLAFTSGLAGSLVLARRVDGRAAAGRRRFRLFDILTMPAYWCLISIAAYRALAELIAAPHRWNKTDHGFAERASDLAVAETDRPAA